MFYLQLRNELWKLFAKKRTYIGFLMFLLAQNAIILVFLVSVERAVCVHPWRTLQRVRRGGGTATLRRGASDDGHESGHGDGSGLHVFLSQREARCRDNPGALVCFRKLHHAEHSLLPRPAALVSHVSPEHLAIHVRSADPVVEDWRVTQHLARLQPHVPGDRPDGISGARHQVVTRSLRRQSPG